MDVTQVFWFNIMPIDSTLLLVLFLILLGFLVVVSLFFTRKIWDNLPTGYYGRGRLLGAIFLLPLFALGLFYLTAESSLNAQTGSLAIGLEIVNTTSKVQTYDYSSITTENTVKNVGNSTIRNFDVSAIGYDSSGNQVANQTWTYIGEINPGQTIPFNISIYKPPKKIVSYKIIITKKYDYPE
jgi:hypothetical protein